MGTRDGTWLVIVALGTAAASAAADPIVNLTPALRIEASGAHVRVPDAPSLDLTSALTIELWACFVATDATPGAEMVKRGDNNNGYVLGINPGTRLVGGIFEKHSNLISSPPPFGEEWHHFAWTYNGSVSRLYFDGALIQEIPFVGVVGTTSTDLVFGIGLEGDGSWNGATAQGWYDEIRLWNVARTTADILGSFDHGLTGGESGLVGYWNFDSGDARDLSPFGNDGQLLSGARVGSPHGVPEPALALLMAAGLVVSFVRRSRR